MTYTTAAEIIKTEMNDSDVFKWTNYNAINSEGTPNIGISRLEDISGKPPDESILLKNINGQPDWAANGSIISRNNNQVEADISMPTNTKRKAIMDDIDAGILLTTYNIIYNVSTIPDAFPLFKIKLQFTITVR